MMTLSYKLVNGVAVGQNVLVCARTMRIASPRRVRSVATTTCQVFIKVDQTETTSIVVFVFALIVMVIVIVIVIVVVSGVASSVPRLGYLA